MAYIWIVVVVVLALLAAALAVDKNTTVVFPGP